MTICFIVFQVRFNFYKLYSHLLSNFNIYKQIKANAIKVNEIKKNYVHTTFEDCCDFFQNISKTRQGFQIC